VKVVCCVSVCVCVSVCAKPSQANALCEHLEMVDIYK